MEQGSRKQGKSWGTKLVGLLMEAAISIWNKRNSMEHNRVAHVLTEVENIRLSQEVNKQLRLGKAGIKQKDKYLFKYTKEKYGHNQESGSGRGWQWYIFQVIR